MTNADARRQPPLGAGVLTAVLVMVVLLLAAFAAMSALSANADARLSDQAAQSVAAYYRADARAERIAHAIGRALSAGGDWRLALNAMGVDTSTARDQARFSFSVPTGDGRTIDVTLVCALKDGRPIGGLTRARWQMVPMEEPSPSPPGLGGTD
jgi:hypothetical protein